MRGRSLLIVILCTAVPAAAQQAPPAPPVTEPAVTVDATKLGVSLDRIERGLRVKPPTETLSGASAPIKLNFQVQVFGTAPRLEFFKDFDPVNGPDRYGAPTHSQMLQFWTPQEFSAPALPISTLAFLAARYIWRAAKKARCEEDLRQYRELVMQGVSVSAPRCTQ